MNRPSTHPGKPLPTIPILCYVLIVAAWIVDLLTPQLFVAAILLNGPIALSGLALSTRLTATLVVFAEIANIIAGYVNGVQAHYHWDSIAVGDRILTAASFLLVGYLTARAQEYARDAGSATERARIATGEKALRRSLEAVRSSLNVELVLRAIVREAIALTDADEARLVIRSSQLHLPDIYGAKRGSREITVERKALEPAEASLMARAGDDALLTAAPGEDPVARMVLESHGAAAMLCERIASGDTSAVLLVFSQQFARGADRLLQSFAEGASVALDQAWLFMQLGYRNEEIAAQKDALEDRSRVIRDIVYALAHDLRTPLAAENVTMRQALEGSYGALPEQYREMLRTTLAANADLRRLVDTLLLVARFESGESSTLRESIDVARAARARLRGDRADRRRQRACISIRSRRTRHRCLAIRRNFAARYRTWPQMPSRQHRKAATSLCAPNMAKPTFESLSKTTDTAYRRSSESGSSNGSRPTAEHSGAAPAWACTLSGSSRRNSEAVFPMCSASRREAASS